MDHKLKIVLLHALIALVVGLPLAIAGHVPDAIYCGFVGLYLWEVSQSKGSGNRLKRIKEGWILQKDNLVYEVLIPSIVSGFCYAILNLIWGVLWH